jgi:hypothetical protein
MSEFDNLTGFGGEAVEDKAPASDAEKAALKAAATEVVAMIKTNPEYQAVRNSRCGDLRVNKILGFGESGNMVAKTQEALKAAVDAGTVTVLPADSQTPGYVRVEDNIIYGTVRLSKQGNGKYEQPFKEGEETHKNGKPNTFRKLEPVPENVGYIVENISATPIEYTTCVYAQDDAGKFVGSEVKKTLMPGEQAPIARPYLTKLALAPEFNLTLANGSIIMKKVSSKDPADILSKPYFQFSRDFGADVNSPEYKERIDEVIDVNGTKKSVVRDEYTEIFGNLNNVTEKAPKAARAKKDPAIQPSKAEIAAQYARNILGM